MGHPPYSHCGAKLRWTGEGACPHVVRDIPPPTSHLANLPTTIFAESCDDGHWELLRFESRLASCESRVPSTGKEQSPKTDEFQNLEQRKSKDLKRRGG